MKNKFWKIYGILCDLIFEYVFFVCAIFAFALLAIKEPFAIDVLIFVIAFNVIWGCIKIYRKRKEKKNGKKSPCQPMRSKDNGSKEKLNEVCGE